MEHSPVRGTSRCAPGAFSLTAPVFRSSRAQKGAWCARRVNYFQASSEPTTSPAPEAMRQSNQQPRQHHTPTRSNHITSADKTKRQSNQQPRQHHTPTRSNRSTTARSHTPTTSPTTSPTPETTRPPHQRFLYCDGETPNISLKYFAKYFCVPKPTASETSTMLSPASADNSWAALLSRMVRMNTEGFIP